MIASNRERQRKWKKKQAADGLRAVTVMLPTLIKELIDKEREKTGGTIAKIIEKAVINLLGSAETASDQCAATASNSMLRDESTDDMQKITAALKSIIQRFEKLTSTGPSVTSNAIAVTNDGSVRLAQQDGYPKEIYRLVRLLHNMEVSHDEIALTLNKRKYKTLAGDNEVKAISAPEKKADRIIRKTNKSKCVSIKTNRYFYFDEATIIFFLLNFLKKIF